MDNTASKFQPSPDLSLLRICESIKKMSDENLCVKLNRRVIKNLTFPMTFHKIAAVYK